MSDVCEINQSMGYHFYGGGRKDVEDVGCNIESFNLKSWWDVGVKQDFTNNIVNGL